MLYIKDPPKTPLVQSIDLTCICFLLSPTFWSVYTLQFQNYSDGLSLSVCSCIGCRVCVDSTHDHIYCKRQRSDAATGLDSASIQSTDGNDSAVIKSTNQNDSACNQLTNQNDSAIVQSTNDNSDADETSQFLVGSLQSTSDGKLCFAQSKIRRLQREVKLCS